jgi:hypothetical protein
MGLNRTTAVRWLFYPIGMGILFGCIVFSLMRLIAVLNPHWWAPWMVPLCALAAMESYWTGRALLNLPVGAFVTPWHIRAAELAGWFLVVQIVDDVVHTHAPISSGTFYITEQSVPQFAILLFCWLASGDASVDLFNLSRLHLFPNPGAPPVERLTARFFRGGGLLLLFTGLLTIPSNHLERLANLTRPSSGGILYNVVLYFAVGTTMLVQVRYEHLSASWTRRHLSVASGLPGRWLRYSLALLVAGILVALLLPTDYTRGVLDVVRMAENVIAVILGIVEFITVLPFAWVFSLFHGGAAHPLTTPPTPKPILPHHQQHGSPPDFLGIIRTAAFWFAALAALVYMGRTYGHLIPRRGPGGLLRGIGSRLMALLRGVWARLRGAPRATRALLRREPETRPAPALPAARMRRRALVPWMLSPRDQIVWYYVGMLRRAARTGRPRTPEQTPYEYGTVLAPRMRRNVDDLHALTEAYVEARYTPLEPTQERASAVRAIWRRVIAGLRAR